MLIWSQQWPVVHGNTKPPSESIRISGKRHSCCYLTEKSRWWFPQCHSRRAVITIVGKKGDRWLDNWPSIDSLHQQVKPQKGDADSERCIESSFHIHGKLTEGGGKCGRAGAGMTAVSTTGEGPRKESVQQEAPQTRVQVLNDSWTTLNRCSTLC